MNLFLPRTIQSQIEIKELISVPNLIVSPQSNRPVSGFIQDIILGIRNLTFNNISLSKEKVFNLLSRLNIHFDKDKKEWTNKEILSLFLPNDLNYKNDDLEIKNGKIINGIFNKKHIGISYGSLIHILWNDYGPEYTKNFINNIQTFIINWMAENGESIGISDTILDPKTQLNIDEIVNESLLDVENDRIKLENGIINQDEFEIIVLNKLNKIRDSTGSLAIKNIFDNNRLKNMVSSGSKGNYLNIAQIMSSVGQQTVRTIDGNFGRIDNGFNQRTLPHYKWNENNPESKGFIKNSYLKGLNPKEFFFHSMSGRLGVIDTAIRTSDSGYLQRKLVKLMEDIHINNGNYVQNSNGQIIQFIYGTDNFDASFLEYNKINLDIEPELLFSDNKKENDILKEIKKEISELELKQVLVPFNINRILNSIESECEVLNTDEYVEIVDNFINSISMNNTIDIFKDYYMKNIKFVIYSNFYSNKLKKIKMSKRNLNLIFQKIERKIKIAIIHPGEMVGILASQSVGEILTQLTLNTFHSAGISSQTKITAGIPRFRELINVSKSPSVPMTKLVFNEGLTDNDKKKYLELMKYSSFKDYINEIEIYYDPNFDFINSIPCYFEKENGESPYVIKILLNNEMMYKKQTCIFDIIQKIKLFLKSNKIIIDYTLDNEEESFIFLTFKNYTEYDLEKVFLICNDLEKETINGFYGIDEIYLEKDTLEIMSRNYLSLLNLPFINPLKSITNNLFETLQVLGIEATRQLIRDEILKVLDDNGIYINMRHINLICDLICHKTTLISMDRHGIKKIDIGCLTKSSFEEPIEQLSFGASFNQVEVLNGISSNIILGQIGNFGTNYNKIYLDHEKIMNNFNIY